MPLKEKPFQPPVYQPQQDTIRQDTTRQDTIRQDTALVAQDTIPKTQPSDSDTAIMEGLRTPKTEILDSIIKAEEQAQQQQASQKQMAPAPKPVKETVPTELDTISDLYEITGATEIPITDRLEKDPATTNFLYHIPASKDFSAGSPDIYKENKVTQGKAYEEVEPKPIENRSRKEEAYAFDWPTYLLIAILIFLGWIRLFYKKYFNLLFKSFYFINYAEELFDENSSLTIQGSTFLNFTYFIIFGMFGLQVLTVSEYNLNFPDYQVFLLFTGFFIAWYLWNAIFKQFVGSVFQKQNAFNEYFYNYNIYRKIAGIVFFPIIVINQYIQEEYTFYLVIAAGMLFAIIYLMHILRGLQIFIKNNVSIFYLILYLCALEFLPLLVLYESIIKEL